MKITKLLALLLVSVMLLGALTSCDLSFLEDMLAGDPAKKMNFTDLGDSWELTSLGDLTEETDIVIPAEFEGKPVTSLGRNSLYRAPYKYEMVDGEIEVTELPKIKSITLPDTITKIGDGAFEANDEITELIIPESVTYIGKEAFRGCSSLTTLTIPEGVKTIGAGAFMNCYSLTSITLPADINTIGESMFEGCGSLTSFTITDKITYIGARAFANCTSLASMSIPSTVITLGDSIFAGAPEEFTVTVSYDNESPKGWSKNWHAGMYGKAINTSAAYLVNVVEPNKARAEELKVKIADCDAEYEAIQGEIASHTQSCNRALELENDSMYREYNKLRKECIERRSQVINKKLEYKDELEKIQTTNQLNYPLERNTEE